MIMMINKHKRRKQLIKSSAREQKKDPYAFLVDDISDSIHENLWEKFCRH